MTRLTRFFAAAVAAGGLAFAVAGQAAAQDVTVGYQLIYNPWKVAIADGEFEKRTGADIKFVKFSSGSKVINAMASGDVDIALAGSAPIAAGVSRGVDMSLFWIVENIAAAEALAVRDGSGIMAPQDLKGKKIGVPFVSTTHFHMLFALEQFGLSPDDVELVNMQPNNIAAAWARGDIDAAFVWHPALGRILDTGHVLTTSGDLCNWGKCTFDGMVVQNEFAEENPEFLAQFVEIVAEKDAAYRANPSAFGADTENAKKIVSLVGGDAKDVPGVLEAYEFPTLEQQASNLWLGGGKDGGAARAIFFTSQFLKSQGKIEELLPDYGAVVTPKFVEMAMEMN